MNINFRTDMADERVDEYKQVHNLTAIEGIKVESIKKDIMKITTVDVLNEKGKAALGKDIGRYITMEVNDIEYITDEEKQREIEEIADILKELVDKKFYSIMVVGLGNEAVTPDSLGPKVISYINVTRHMLRYASEFVVPGTREISAISPGVLGTTGIETEEIVESVVKFVKPDIVIVIDSLASMSVARVGRTIQIGNTGITPGAGIGNRRSSLNKESLGVDVIAIGVPTVVDMATITNEAIEKLLKNNKISSVQNNFLKDKDERYNVIADTLHTENYIVTPKEIDAVILKISEIIASGLNVAL